MDSITLKKIEEYVMPDTGIKPVKLAILFGTRHGVELFCDETYKLWKEGYFQYLVISGGSTLGIYPSEAEVISKRLIVLGMPKTSILLEDQSTNTGENVIFSKKIVERHFAYEEISSIICIGKISSSRRYLMTVEKHWPNLVKYLYPVNYFGVPKSDWHTHQDFKSRVLLEWAKIPEYLIKGYLAEL